MRASALIRMAVVKPVTNYDAYFTATSVARRPSAIRALQPLVSLPGMISLGGGMPNPAMFPIKGIRFELADGVALDLPPASVAEALQYSATPGLPELVSRLKDIQVSEHAPPLPFSVSVTPGSQDGLAKLFDALVGRGDTLLVEAPTYSGSLAFLDALGCTYCPVPTDGDGLVPAALAEILDGWDGSRPKPRVLYCIPTGGNPTGASLPLERKHEIYAVAQRHDLLIIEDDPYRYLQFGGPARTPSLLSLDTDGRVVRCDSLSKVLSAGLRVGFVTGPSAVIERVNLHNQASVMQASGLSQALVLALLRHWRAGEGGGAGIGPAFEAHLAAVRAFYSGQCDALLAAADRHLCAQEDGSGAPLARYSRPSAGMFVWMDLSPAGVRDSFDLITREAVAARVLLVPGCAFLPGGPVSAHVRAAFSTASPAEMGLAMQRLGALLRAKRAATSGTC